VKSDFLHKFDLKLTKSSCWLFFAYWSHFILVMQILMVLKV